MAEYPFGPKPKGAGKRVCIIGAGANGLATLKILAETDEVRTGHWSIVAFEGRDKVGGVWYHPPYRLILSHFSHVELGIPPLPLEIHPEFFIPTGDLTFPKCIRHTQIFGRLRNAF